MPKKILLIEYEPHYLERLRAVLATPEFQLVEAHDGEEGLSSFAASKFDLILLSGMLPRLPSAEVIREIRKKGGATAPPIVLMMTGYKGSNSKADAQKVGAFEILAKPFSDDALRATVDQALQFSDLGARTMRIDTSEFKKEQAKMTSSDIFSDVLEDLVEGATPKGPPAPPSASRPASRADDEMERRLRDTLSDILDRSRAHGPTRPATPAGSTPAPSAPEAQVAARHASVSDIDRMLSDTLSGLAIAPKPKTPPAATPPAPQAPFLSAPAPEPPREPAGVVAGGPDRFGQYEIVQRIASGGMAELYKAKQRGVEGFQKTVAIKKILPHLADNDEFITMFADEAKLAAQLNHPNIIHIYDLGKIESGGYFIAMEHIDGRDLGAILHSGREVGVPLPVPLAVYIASKVASALDYAHRRRDPEGRELTIVHRDVSPQNILISYEGDIKLCDFGIAKAASKASQTQSGALKGKLQYMSPEQAWGKPIDRRSDLFSLGSVLHEMLTSEKLFRGDSDLTVLEKVRRAEVPAPSELNPEVPKSLDAVVLKALAREPEERYANASDLLRDLEPILYSYTPAPGSADVAIYLHRLQAEESAAAEARAREAEQPVAEEPARKLKAKGAPLPRKTGSAPRPMPASATPAAFPPPAVGPAPPAPKPATGSGVFGAYSPRRVEAEKKKRAPLYWAIGVAVVALGAVVILLALKKSPPRAESAPGQAGAVPAVTVPPEVPVAPVATPAAVDARALDPKAIEEEVQRQLAQKKRELQKSLEATKAAPQAAKKPEPAVAVPAQEPEPAAPVPGQEPEPAPVATEPPVVEAEPTVAPTEVPAPVVEAPTPRPVPVAAPSEPEVTRGDLVGPGPGVVEPSLAGPPKVNYPQMARQQRLSGRVVVLVLVDEEGSVSQARLQQGMSSRSGVNEAVVEAVRRARFRPATKNGIPVKMWRTVVVEVKP